MKLLTREGSLAPVRQRFNFVGSSRPLLSILDSVDLAPIIPGVRNRQTFYDIYLSNPWVHAAVNHIAWGVSRIPVKVYEVLDADGNVRRIRGDVPTSSGRPTAGQALDRLLNRPEPRRGRMRSLRRPITDTLIAGNGLQEKRRGPSGIEALVHIPWRRVTVIEGAQEDIAFYEITDRLGRDPRRIIPEDVIHYELGNDPDKPIGISPLASLKYTVALHNAIQRHLTSFFGNSARPSGNLQLDKGTKKEVLELIREEIKQLYTNPENAGKVLVTTGQWQSITESPEHSEIIELVRLSREEVAAAFLVPPPLMGILDRAIMSNIRELRTHNLRDVIGPWAVLFEGEINAQLVAESPALTNHRVEFDLNEQLRPDFEALAKALRELQSTYSLNERRKIVNVPPIDHPDADAVYIELNMAPIGGEEDDDEPSEPVEGSTRGKRFIKIPARSRESATE